MRILIIIGAGASFDCWPKHISQAVGTNLQKIPLARDLFSPQLVQDKFLKQYDLMGLASKLRRISESVEDFDIELELDNLFKIATDRKDLNKLQELFKTRFYLHNTITSLTRTTLKHTRSHHVYIDLLDRLKDWIDESSEDRFVDIVSFNYDNLIEDALKNVYGYDWSIKNKNNPLEAYYSGKNMKIFKPHGSINWGKEIVRTNPGTLFEDFNKINVTGGYRLIDPENLMMSIQNNYIPAIAVPLREKEHFEECPLLMLNAMKEAIPKANKIITLGWKGADQHFTNLLKSSKQTIQSIHVVSPKADTHLDDIFPREKIQKVESTFSRFVNDPRALESLLDTFSLQII